MTSLVVMLFFGATGVLLNHQDWTLGSRSSQVEAVGTVPAELKGPTGYDTMTLARWVVDHEGVAGRANGNGTDGTQMWVSYLGPGYVARITADTTTGEYQVTQARTGVAGVISDIHRAKGTGTVWSWVNDLSGVLLVLIGATGLLITWLTKAKNRRRDLVLAGIGLALAVIAWWTTLR